MRINQIIGAIEEVAPRAFQESWDNTCLQVGNTFAECTGVLVCVDVTPEVIDEAHRLGCSLVVSHHPLIFKGIKQLIGATPQQAAIMNAIALGISVYSNHTALDNVPGGVSYTMAAKLGIHVQDALVPKAGEDSPKYGLGIYGDFEERPTVSELIERVKRVFDSPVVRTTNRAVLDADDPVTTIALCGGSGGEFIPVALDRRAQVYITSDVRYHDFVDYGDRLVIIDIGHYESEQCTKEIFKRIITDRFGTEVPVHLSQAHNPIHYL